MRTLRDDETLRNGMVWVFYNLNNVAVQKKYMEYVYLVEKSLAGRISALHYCYTEETLWPYVAGLQLFFAESDRFRLRPFMGSLQEIEFYLQTFGIPTHLSPLREDGSWCLEWLHESLEAMRLREETEMQMERAGVVIPALLDASSCKSAETTTSNVPCTESIVIPRRFDVILGKSAHARVHTGNRRAIHLCQMNFEAYEEANKFRKTEVAERIVSIIRESGGRFLRWEESGGGWVEETDEITARKKIGHFLRYMRSKVGKEDNEAASLTEMNGKATKRLSLFPLPPLGPPTEESVHSEIPPKRAYRV